MVTNGNGSFPRICNIESELKCASSEYIHCNTFVIYSPGVEQSEALTDIRLKYLLVGIYFDQHS